MKDNNDVQDFGYTKIRLIKYIDCCANTKIII